MARYGDPEALEALARAVAADAAAVHARARAVEASVARMRWQGTGADAFREAVARDAVRMQQAARELEEAAAALRVHAAAVRSRLAEIQALERAVTRWLDAAVDRVSGWAGALPAAGDRAWLEVADQLRARGVRL